MCFLFGLFSTKHISFAQNICSWDCGQVMTKNPCIPISHLIYCIILFILFLFLIVVYPLNPIPSCQEEYGNVFTDSLKCYVVMLFVYMKIMLVSPLKYWMYNYRQWTDYVTVHVLIQLNGGCYPLLFGFPLFRLDQGYYRNESCLFRKLRFYFY